MIETRPAFAHESKVGPEHIISLNGLEAAAYRITSGGTSTRKWFLPVWGKNSSGKQRTILTDSSKPGH